MGPAWSDGTAGNGMVKSTRRAIERTSPAGTPSLSPLRAKARITGVIADNRALALTSRDWKGAVPGGSGGFAPFPAGRGSFRKFESEFDERAASRAHLDTAPDLRTLYTAASWRRNCERA